jgi:hypothetical protein
VRIAAALGTLSVAAVAALALALPAGAANECAGLQVCVPIAGPWVVVSASTAVPRSRVEWQMTCPRGHVAGGLDARLSVRAIDVAFLGTLGSPVNPGISTARSVVFVATYAGQARAAPTFKPLVGCMPSAGGGARVPTAFTAFPPSKPVTRRVSTVRVRPGSTALVQRCARGERLIGGSHALAFATRTPPSASLASSMSGTDALRADRIVVRVHGDAELAGVRALVQVQALCSRSS